MIPNFKAWSKKHQKMFWVWEIKKADHGVTLVSAVAYLKGGKTIYLYDEKIGDDLILLKSTGLKDKNGKEIYEGDVLKSHEIFPKKGKVVFDFHRSAFGIISDGLFHWMFGEEWTFAEKIGNIYENPGLIEEVE